MMPVLRLAIVLATPILFWLVWSVSPDILSLANMRWLGGLFVVVWGMVFHVLNKIADLSALPGLSAIERRRLAAALSAIRRRLWGIGVVILLCAVLVWLISSVSPLSDSLVAPLAIGFLIGSGLSYLVMMPGWLNEIHSFCDQVRSRNEQHLRTQATLKRIEEEKRPSKGNPAPCQ